MATHFDHGYADLDDTTADDDARAILHETRAELGMLPSVVARMAISPELYRAFRAAGEAFGATSLTALEQEVVILAFARTVGCDVCVTMHTHLLVKAGGADVAKTIAAGAPIADRRLRALVAFTDDVVATRGDVTPEVFAEFLAVGFTRKQALEIVLGLGAYTMSTFANRLTGGTLRPSATRSAAPEPRAG